MQYGHERLGLFEMGNVARIVDDVQLRVEPPARRLGEGQLRVLLPGQVGIEEGPSFEPFLIALGRSQAET